LRNLGLTSDAVVRRRVLEKTTYCHFLSWRQAVYPLWWSSPRRANRTVLCWSVKTDTEHHDSYEGMKESRVALLTFR